MLYNFAMNTQNSRTIINKSVYHNIKVCEINTNSTATHTTLSIIRVYYYMYSRVTCRFLLKCSVFEVATMSTCGPEVVQN